MPVKNWSSRLAFIVTASSFAVGLGNIWRFPYITGENGGGAFLLVYLFLVVLIGVPLLSMEMGLGALARSSPLTGFGKLSAQPRWNIIGWLTFFAALFIKMYYVVILAWIAVYLMKCLSGELLAIPSTELSAFFEQTIASSSLIFVAVVVLIILSVWVVSADLHKGLEPVSRILMTLLLVLIVGLALWACTLEGVGPGLRFYLYPDFSKITVDTFVQALGQLFFSVGVGMVAAFIFGSYTQKGERLVSSAMWIALCDTGIALLAGFIVFPALFSFGLAPDSGPDLIFITLSSLFSTIGGGQLLGSLFFLLLLIAGFTSLIAVMQGLKESLMDRFKLSSRQSLIILAAVLLTGSVPMILSFKTDPLTIAGHTPYDLFDYLTNSIMLPLGALLIVLFSMMVVGYDEIARKLGLPQAWRFITKPLLYVVVPVAISLILFNALI
ncbi:MAG: sodium-dependent transporter [Saprospiraceae bacterium]|nr:sodium-dependent transporter [Saprospiraceae bacterium]